jgi:hypothetical protein
LTGETGKRSQLPFSLHVHLSPMKKARL